MKIQSLISKKIIKAWLDNYQSLAVNSRPIDEIPSNGGCKSYDGISGRQLNKIMLEAALEELPPLLKRCVYARWISPKPLGETLRNLGLTKDEYYRRCNWAIDSIYYHVNGEAARLLDLHNKINNKC